MAATNTTATYAPRLRRASSPPSHSIRRLTFRSSSSAADQPRRLSVRADQPRRLSVRSSSSAADQPRRLSVRSHAADRPSNSLDSASPKIAPSTNGAANPPSSSPPASSALDFLTLCHRLKATKRRGWINHGIKGPESIADHMYRMALMALIVGDLPGINRERCVKMAIVHDIAEAIVGDITPSDGVPKEEKSRLEQTALNEMCQILGGGSRAEEIQELWAEYENNSTREANLVKDFDKVEMILQALEYEMEHGKVLDEFFLSTAGKFQTEVGRNWAAEITCRRNNYLRNRHK